MAYDILALIRAAQQGHDQVALHAEMMNRVQALWAKLPSKPLTSKRLTRQLANGERLDVMDADDAVVAIGTVVGADQPALLEELQLFVFVVARLGGTAATFRVGHGLMVALRAIPPG